jgi:hypothetical protein
VLRLRLRPNDAAPCGSGSGSASVADPDNFDAIRIQIRPQKKPGYEAGSGQMMRILADPDPIMLSIKFCNKIFLL